MFTDYSENSRVWVYQSSRAFTPEEVTLLEQKITAFSNEWSAHKLQLKADGKIVYNQFIVLIVDENQYEASGCSIDSSIKFIQNLETKFSIKLMDRMQVAYKSVDNKIETCSLHDLTNLLETGKVNLNTIVFNNLVATKKELITNWEIELGNSWHKNFITSLA